MAKQERQERSGLRRRRFLQGAGAAAAAVAALRTIAVAERQ